MNWVPPTFQSCDTFRLSRKGRIPAPKDKWGPDEKMFAVSIQFTARNVQKLGQNVWTCISVERKILDPHLEQFAARCPMHCSTSPCVSCRNFQKVRTEHQRSFSRHFLGHKFTVLNTANWPGRTIHQYVTLIAPIHYKAARTAAIKVRGKKPFSTS